MASQEPPDPDVGSLKSRYADLRDDDDAIEVADFDGFQEASCLPDSGDSPVISMETSDVLDGTWFRANGQSKRIRAGSDVSACGSDGVEPVVDSPPKRMRQQQKSLLANKTTLSRGLQTTVLISQEDLDRGTLLGASSKKFSLDPIAISKSLKTLGFDETQVKDIRINKHRNLVAIEFVTPECSGISVLLDNQSFGPFAVKCYRPAVDSVDVSWGVIGPLHFDIDLDELLSEISCEGFQVVRLLRLPRFASGKKEDSLSVKIGFSGPELPRSVKLGLMSFPVRVFNEPPLRCYRCQRPGHMASGCNAPRRCVVCSADHRKEECTASHPLCANCKGPHSASSKDCTFNQDAKRVQQLVKQGMTYRSATRKVTVDRREIQVGPDFGGSPTHVSVSQSTSPPQFPTQDNSYSAALTGGGVDSLGPQIVSTVADVHQSQGSYYIPRRYPRVPAATFVDVVSPSAATPVTPAPLIVPSAAEALCQSTWEKTIMEKCETLIMQKLGNFLKICEKSLIDKCEKVLLGKCESRLVKVCSDKCSSAMVQQCEDKLLSKCEDAIATTVSSLFTKMSGLLVELFALNLAKEGQQERKLLLIGLIRNHFGSNISEPLLQQHQNVKSTGTVAPSPAATPSAVSKAVRGVPGAQEPKTKSHGVATSRTSRKP